jgi:hypothetical protein
MADITEQQLLSQDPEVLGLQRQRALANLLTGQAFNQPQGQMISGHYVRPSALQQALPMINAGIGALTNANLDTKQQELANALRGKQQEAVQQYMAAKTPQEQFMAGTSQYAPAQLKSAAYEMLKPTVLAPDSSIVKPSFGAEGGYQTMATGPEKKTELIRDYNQAVSSGAFKGSIVDYDLMRRNASANRQYINLQNQLPFIEQTQQKMADDLIKEYSNLKSIPSQIQNLDKAVELSKSPAYLGSGAEAKLAITKFFNNNLGTNINADKVVNTEELGSVLFQSTMENLKKLDAQPSQMQQQIMQKAFGTIGTDPAAIPKIVEVQKDILLSKAREHNARVDETEQGPAKMKYAHSIKIKVPETEKPKVNNVRSLADQILGL